MKIFMIFSTEDGTVSHWIASAAEAGLYIHVADTALGGRISGLEVASAYRDEERGVVTRAGSIVPRTSFSSYTLFDVEHFRSMGESGRVRAEQCARNFELGTTVPFEGQKAGVLRGRFVEDRSSVTAEILRDHFANDLAVDLKPLTIKNPEIIEQGITRIIPGEGSPEDYLVAGECLVQTVAGELLHVFAPVKKTAAMCRELPDPDFMKTELASHGYELAEGGKLQALNDAYVGGDQDYVDNLMLVMASLEQNGFTAVLIDSSEGMLALYQYVIASVFRFDPLVFKLVEHEDGEGAMTMMIGEALNAELIMLLALAGSGRLAPFEAIQRLETRGRDGS